MLMLKEQLFFLCLKNNCQHKYLILQSQIKFYLVTYSGASETDVCTYESSIDTVIKYFITAKRIGVKKDYYINQGYFIFQYMENLGYVHLMPGITVLNVMRTMTITSLL